MAVEVLDHDILVDQLIRENDETSMALPDIESEPHLLISKVRKHYMDYVIKLLSANYETNQKLINKNIYLPSAIWRCAKNIEMNAAQACMVVQLYRKNITSMINQLKNDTKKGKLNRKLYECLNKPPQNEKKTQTHYNVKETNCSECGQSKRKRRQVNSISPKHIINESISTQPKAFYEHEHNYAENYMIPVAMNTSHNTQTQYTAQNMQPPVPVHVTNYEQQPVMINNKQMNENYFQQPPSHRASIESDPDELMMQLDKLFQGNHNDDYDIFEGALCDRLDITQEDHSKKDTNAVLDTNRLNSVQESVIENHAAQIRSLDERLASLTGLLVNNDSVNSVVNQKTDNIQRSKKSGSSKWLCEEYHLKQKLNELLDRIGDYDRKSLERIKQKFIYYFGYDSDDEGIISPLEETPEFVVSCKERIAPWVVKILTPYYIRGHIIGKGVFKSLAKHLIRLIYQCSKYPAEYEVNSFITDFLKNHKSIKCEADFKEFKIQNI
ncbi:uncharacterized protein LOC142982283 [Anticarsia gemmatalis]|uniref:uncharacterized protein LOC142982283 n=1 Tax=Anticarsia gemmatalis TaxID=129554 RepID=UPI003F759769